MSDNMLNKALQYTPDDKTLDFWIKNRMNVLLIGKHGVGKTTMIEEAFKRNGLKSRYFSASTMDPWVDFIGIPKEVLDENGQPYLELIKPKEFRDDQVEAIFFDELNRSHKKVRNAVMELIQFKSINGRKFPNLKIIWAAVNPKTDDDAYDVEDLDPAQRDRFTVQIEIPYKPSKKYFVKKYGEEIGYDAISWWDSLPDNVKNYVSPRKLDSAISYMQLGGNLRHVLPPCCNVEALNNILTKGSPSRRLKTMLDPSSKTPDEEIVSFINDIDNFNILSKDILSNDKLISKLNSENLSTLYSGHTKQLENYFTNNFEDHKTLLEDIVSKSPKTSKLAKSAAKIIKTKTAKRKVGTIAVRKKAPLVNHSMYVFVVPPAATKSVMYTSLYLSPSMTYIVSLFDKKSASKLTSSKTQILNEIAYGLGKFKPSDDEIEKLFGFVNYFIASSAKKTILAYEDTICDVINGLVAYNKVTIEDIAKNNPFILHFVSSASASIYPRLSIHQIHHYVGTARSAPKSAAPTT